MKLTSLSINRKRSSIEIEQVDLEVLQGSLTIQRAEISSILMKTPTIALTEGDNSIDLESKEEITLIITLADMMSP